MNTKQIASNSLHPPVIAGASTGGESWGFFDSMDKHQILGQLAEIITTQEDLDALKSLIHERKKHLAYRQMDRDFYFPAKPETIGLP